MVCSVLGCALFIPGGVLFIPRGCLIHPHPALIIPRVGLNWSPGMNRSLYLNCAMDVRCSLFVVVVVVVRHTQKLSLNIFNCGKVRRRSSYTKNPPNCAHCCWRARVPVKWHLADFDFDFWHEKSI